VKRVGHSDINGWGDANYCDSAYDEMVRQLSLKWRMYDCAGGVVPLSEDVIDAFTAAWMAEEYGHACRMVRDYARGRY